MNREEIREIAREVAIEVLNEFREQRAAIQKDLTDTLSKYGFVAACNKLLGYSEGLEEFLNKQFTDS